MMARAYAEEERRARRAWTGPVERYDLLKEAAIVFGGVFAVVVVLAVVFSGPAAPSVTFRQWASEDPQDFAATTLAELTGTSGTAEYGPPYNDATGALQSLGPVTPQTWSGIALPIDTARDFVTGPLAAWAPLDPRLDAALRAWEGASEARRSEWGRAALAARLDASDRAVTLAGAGDTGPVPVLLGSMLAMARSGALDAQLLDAPDAFYSSRHTRSLMFLADGEYLGSIAERYHLLGEQWGVMNEVGSWPGQPWLWFYALWYQIPPWSTIGTDIVVIVTVTFLVAIVVLVPFIPGLRSLPKALGVYRLIWRSYYREHAEEPPPPRRED